MARAASQWKSSKRDSTFFEQQQPNNEMNTPTPRTDAAWNATFDSEQISAGRTARALRECSQQLETELATLRAELEKVYALVTPVGFDLPGGIFETAQAVTELRAERDQLRACLRDLVDEQNGAPLELRRKHWQAAMDEALAALTKTEDAT